MRIQKCVSIPNIWHGYTEGDVKTFYSMHRFLVFIFIQVHLIYFCHDIRINIYNVVSSRFHDRSWSLGFIHLVPFNQPMAFTCHVHWASILWLTRQRLGKSRVVLKRGKNKFLSVKKFSEGASLFFHWGINAMFFLSDEVKLFFGSRQSNFKHLRTEFGGFISA